MVHSHRNIIARVLWFFPLLLVLLTINQVYVGYNIHRTLNEGMLLQAEITELVKTNRTEISYEYVNLRIVLPDGQVMLREKMTFPHSFLPEIEGKKVMDVRVLPDSPEEIVFASMGRAHWRLAYINAAMSLMGTLLLAWGIFAWNRYLRRKGDPATREQDIRAPNESPALIG